MIVLVCVRISETNMMHHNRMANPEGVCVKHSICGRSMFSCQINYCIFLKIW